jgi:hypothetical protein
VFHPYRQAIAYGHASFKGRYERGDYEAAFIETAGVADHARRVLSGDRGPGRLR